MIDYTTHARRTLMQLLAALLFVAAMASFAHAAPYTWTTSGSGSVLTDGAGTWNTSALNWTTTGAGAAVAWPNATTDINVFGVNSGAAGTVTVGSVSTNGITFNQPGSSTYLLSGGTISLGGTTPTITTNANAAIGSTLAGTAGLTKAGNGTLTLSGSNSFTGGTTVSAGGLVVSGTTGGGNFAAQSSSNTSTTTVDIASGGRLNAGSLTVKNIGNSGTVAMTVSAGGYLGGSSPSIGRNGGAGILTVNGGTAVLTGNSSMGSRYGAGIVTLNSGVYTAAGTTRLGDNSVVGGATSGTSRGTFAVAGGTATLGTLAIAGGALNSGTGEFAIGTVNLSGSGVLTVSNVIQVADASRATATINVSGGTLNAPGIALLPGTYGDTSSSASVNVTGGSVFLGSGGFTQTGTNGTVSIALSGGTIGASADWSSAVPMTLANDNGGVTFTAANASDVASTITLSGGLSGAGGLTKSGAGTVVLNGANAFAGTTSVTAGTLQIGASGTTGSLNTASTITGSAGGTLAFSRTNTITQGTDFGSVIGGAINVTQLGSGTLVLNGANTYTGTTSINAGALQLGNGGATGSLNPASTITGSSGGTLVFSRTDTITQGTDFGSAIGGAISVLQNGSGTLVLNGANAYTGSTRIGGGTLSLGGVNALAGSTLDMNAGDSGTLAFGVSGTNTYNIGGLIGSRNIVTTGAALLSIGGNGTSGSYSGGISGGGALTKVGSGTLTLSGSNSFTGNTQIFAGALSLGNVNALAGSTLDMNAGDAGTLAFGVSGTNTYNIGGLIGSRNVATSGSSLLSVGGNGTNGTYSGGISGAGSFTKVGSGTLTLSGSNSYTGATRISAGVLTLGGTNALAGSTLDMNAGDSGTLAFGVSGSSTYNIGGLVGSRNIVTSATAFLSVGGNGESGTYSGVISGGGSFTKVGSGTLTLSGNNSYTAGTTVSAGGLVVSGTTGGGTFTANVGSGSTTTVDIASGGRLNAGTLNIKFASSSGTAAMTVSAGGYLGGSNPGIGRNGGVGSLTVNGGTAVLTGNSTLGLRGGAGIVTLNSGAYTATGTTQVGNNSIQGASVTSRGTFTVAGGTATLGTLAIAGGVLNSGTNEFVIGTVNLSGAGVFTVSNVIQVADASRATATINVSGGTLNAPGIALLPGTYGDTSSSASVNVTGGSVFLGSGGFTQTGTNGTVSIALSGGTIGASADWASAVPMTLSNDNGGVTIRAADAASVARNITLSGVLSGTAGLTKTGAGTLTLSGNNTYSGQTRVSAGILALGGSSAIPNQSNLLVDGGGFNLAGFNDTVGIVTLTSGSIFGSGTLAGSSYALQGGALNAILSSGAITVSTGTTTLGSAGRFNSASGLTISSGQLTLGGNETVGSFVLTGGILAGSGNTLTSGSAYDVRSGSVVANLGGAIGLVKSTEGVVVLTGNNTFTGLTTISGGTLSVGNGGSTGALAGNVLNNAALVFNRSNDMTYAGNVSGSGNLTKLGTGKLTLTGSSSYAGTTAVSNGGLAVNGLITGSVAVASGAILGGSGKIAGSIGGDGLIAPGNSPGILTVTGQLDATASTAFAFELSQTGAPAWNNASNSLNDILRLTATGPFTTSLASTNAVNVYFDVTNLTNGDTFLGGFFVDNPSSTSNLLATGLGTASFNFFVRGDGNGLNSYNGSSYYTLSQYMAMHAGITGVTQSVVPVASANFADGTITTGQVTQFVVVPEPGAVIVAGIGITMAAWSLRKRRRITRD